MLGRPRSDHGGVLGGWQSGPDQWGLRFACIPNKELPRTCRSSCAGLCFLCRRVSLGCDHPHRAISRQLRDQDRLQLVLEPAFSPRRESIGPAWQ